MSSILLSDILYFSSIDTSLHPLVKRMYEHDPTVFEEALQHIFSIEYSNQLRSIAGAPTLPDSESQEELDRAVSDVVQFCHQHLSNDGRSFLHSKGITDEQIERYRIGDLHVLQHDQPQSLELMNQMIERHSNRLTHRVFANLALYMKAIRDRYSSTNAITYPSFDSSGEFSGVVYRTIGFQRIEGQVRNMFKFYSPYNYSYLFNEGVLSKYDHIYVVEGVSDALALIRAGYENVVSPSMVRLSPHHIKMLQGKHLNILFDRDMGGYAGTKYIMARMPVDYLDHVCLTPNGIDFDEEDPDKIHYYMNNLDQYDLRFDIK